MPEQMDRDYWNWSFRVAVCLALLAWEDTPAQHVPALAADRPPAAADIDRMVQQLGDPHYTVRERASRELWLVGKAAEPALQKALLSSDFEIVYRARQILDRFRWGIFVETPPETIKLIHRFRFGGMAERQQVCRQLSAAKNETLLRQLIALESDKQRQGQLASQFLRPEYTDPASGGHSHEDRVSPDKVTALLLKGELDDAERLLESATDDASLRAGAALALARGRLDAKVAALRQRLKQQPGASQQRRLAFLLRAKGDLAAAIESAAADDELVGALLLEAGQWAEVARRKAKVLSTSDARSRAQIEELGRLAAYQRMAGQTQAFDRTLASLVKACSDNSRESWFSGAVLMLNDRCSDGLEIAYRGNHAEGFHLLCRQCRFREAFRRAGLADVVHLRPNWVTTLGLDSGPRDRKAQGFRLGCEMARTLHDLGEEQTARELVAALASVATQETDQRDNQLRTLVRCEMDVGLFEQAAAHAAPGLKRPTDRAYLFHQVFGDQGEIACVLWPALRAQHVAESDVAAFERLRRLLTAGAAAAGSLDELRNLTARVEKNMSSQREVHTSHLLTIATFFQSRKNHDLAIIYAEKAAAAPLSTHGRIKLGDLFAAEKRWDRAAQIYEDAWGKDSANAITLYLLGHAKLQLGKKAEGQRQMDLALLLPLDDATRRYYLIEAIKRLGLEDVVAQQCEFLLKTCPFGDWAAAKAHQELGNRASHRGEYLAAAEHWERLAVSLIQRNTFLHDSEGYLRLPFEVHVARARGMLLAGKTAEAIEEIRKAEATLPGKTNFVLDVIPQLEKAGRTAEANALFERTMKLHQDVCDDFPRSALHHNNLAWLAASLSRDLDKARTHASQAVQLQPSNANYLDTLAEVRFRQGDRAEAIRQMTRCIELEPTRSYFRKQLDRFQAK